MKKYVICMILSFVTLVSVPQAYAAKFSFGFSESLNVDISETYTKGEHTMIPLRKAAESLGYEVIWHSEDASVTVENETVHMKIRIGSDSYYVEGHNDQMMTNPVMVGVAPELTDGKTYVPAVMLHMLNHYNNRTSNH